MYVFCRSCKVSFSPHSQMWDDVTSDNEMMGFSCTLNSVVFLHYPSGEAEDLIWVFSGSRCHPGDQDTDSENSKDVFSCD